MDDLTGNAGNMGVPRPSTPTQAGTSTAKPFSLRRKDGSSIFKKRLTPIKTARAMLAEDVRKLQEAPEELGMTESEKEKQIADARAQSDAAANAQMNALQRTALAGQGFQQGALSEASRETAQEAVKGGVEATAAVNEANRELIARESARIRSELDAARARAKLFGEKVAKGAGATMSYTGGALKSKLTGE